MTRPNTRERFLKATAQLLEERGYHSVGLSDVIERSDAPRGSLYYYFPEGKEQLFTEAIVAQGREMVEFLSGILDDSKSVSEAIRAFGVAVGDQVSRSGWIAGGSITAIAVEAPLVSDTMHEVCASIYDSFIKLFNDRLRAEGMNPVQAAHSAFMITSAIEGALVLIRLKRSTQPLEIVVDQLAGYLDQLQLLQEIR